MCNILFLVILLLHFRLSSPANIHQRMLHFMRPEGMATDSPDNVQQSLLNKYRCKFKRLFYTLCIFLSLSLFPADAYLLERTSLQSIHYLIGQVCEALSLWRLLCEYQFDLIANGLDNVRIHIHVHVHYIHACTVSVRGGNRGRNNV